MKMWTLCVASVIAAAAGAASAGNIQLDKTPFSSGDGGAFQVTVLGGYAGEIPPSCQFLTFCLEKNEGFDPGKCYSTTIGTATTGWAGSDPISPFTAFLYSNFRKGTLSGFNAASLKDYGDLQDAIWALEDEISVPAAGMNKFYDMALASGWTDLGDVRVLNLYYQNGNFAQDQLTIVPLPTAAWSGLAMIGSMAAIRRIRRGR
jgi:hypothetical protein